MIAQGVPSLGTMAMGAAAEHLQLRLPVAAGAIVCLALWAWTWRMRGPMAAALEDVAPVEVGS